MARRLLYFELFGSQPDVFRGLAICVGLQHRPCVRGNVDRSPAPDRPPDPWRGWRLQALRSIRQLLPAWPRVIDEPFGDLPFPTFGMDTPVARRRQRQASSVRVRSGGHRSSLGQGRGTRLDASLPMSLRCRESASNRFRAVGRVLSIISPTQPWNRRRRPCMVNGLASRFPGAAGSESRTVRYALRIRLHPDGKAIR